MRAFRKTALILGLFLVFAPASFATTARDWTFLVYMAANNDLEPDAMANLDELVQ